MIFKQRHCNLNKTIQLFYVTQICFSYICFVIRSYFAGECEIFKLKNRKAVQLSITFLTQHISSFLIYFLKNHAAMLHYENLFSILKIAVTNAFQSLNCLCINSSLKFFGAYRFNLESRTKHNKNPRHAVFC